MTIDTHMIYDSIKYVQGNRSLPSRVRPRRKILVARYVRTLTTPKCDVTKYVEERRIRKGCERQRDGVCIGVCGCVCVYKCVYEYGSFTPSRTEGR